MCLKVKKCAEGCFYGVGYSLVVFVVGRNGCSRWTEMFFWLCPNVSALATAAYRGSYQGVAR